MLLEAIEQIRSAERSAERIRQAAREKKKELLRAAHQEGERRLEILRQELEETRQEQERLLRALQHAGCVQIEPLSELREKEVLGMLAEAPTAPSETRRGQQTLLQARDYLKQCGVRFSLLQKRTKVPEERLLSRYSLEETLKTGEKINRLGRSIEEHKRERKQLEERRRLLEHWTACPAPLGSRGTETTQLLYGTLPFAVPWTDFTHALA